jgi:uncharacterized delta-60 repeat protein
VAVHRAQSSLMFGLQRALTRLVLVGLLTLPFLVAAQQREDGYLDTNFTANCFPNTFRSARAIVPLFDGKILAGGDFSVDVTCANAIVRLRADGSTDTAFQSPFVFNSQVNAILLHGNGYLVAGRMGDPNSGDAYPIARITAAGLLDNSFPRVSPSAFPAVLHAMTFLPDGRILAVGEEFVQSSKFGVIYRFAANNQNRDAAYVTDAVSSGLPAIESVVLLNNGQLLISGAFDRVLGTNRNGIARLNSNLTLDSAFNTPLGAGAVVREIAVQPDGRILIAGGFPLLGQQRMLARLNSNGSLDSTFDPVAANNRTGSALALQPDGKILFGYDAGVARLLSNGALDTEFGPMNSVHLQLGTDAQDVTALTFTSNSNLLVGAQRVTANSVQRQGVVRLFGMVPPLPPPPGIITQPVSHFVRGGDSIVFSVNATGAPPLTYAWRRNGEKVTGATNSTLAITNVNSTHIGNYTVVVSNPGGSVTSGVARLSVEVFRTTLTLETNGPGVILPSLAGQSLEIGRTFTITAKPVAGNLFSNWTGSVTSTSPVLTFVMQSNLTFVANFHPSPFIPIRGSYQGLFYNPGRLRHDTSGALLLTLDDKGGFSGTVRQGSALRKFRGAFTLERVARVVLPATRTAAPLVLDLEIDVVNAVIQGAVAFSTNTSTNSSALYAVRNGYSKTAPAPNAGRYNVAIPGGDNAVLAPVGDGILSASITTAGRVSGSGTLADGTVAKFVTATSSGGSVPVYVPLYGGQGSLFGWLTFDPAAENHVAGTLEWFKPATASGRYPNGFRITIPDVVGSTYTNPAATVPVLTWTNPVAVLTGGNLSSPQTNSVTLELNNKILGPNNLTLTISRSKGSVSGTFTDPASGQRRAVKALVLPQQNQVRGHFLGNTQGGGVVVQDGAVEEAVE